MMTLLAKRMFTVLLAISCGLAGGCGPENGKTAGELLELALAGMTGTDGVTFEGETALRVDGRQLPEASLYYGGELIDHKSLRIYNLLPDAAKSQELSGDLKQRSERPTLYSRLEKSSGRWRVLSLNEDEGGNPLPGLNPIRQLEELKIMKKTVTKEVGAGGKVRLLRIELDPQQAHNQLAAELEAEMSALRTASTSATSSSDRTTAGVSPLEILWNRENGELQRRLRDAKVETVYHLEVDVRRNLPKSLSRQRTITFLSSDGKTRRETFVSRVDFYGYK
ncbi:hypothetical protein SAMN04487895_103127 [Paenibacillus sophorae]|uniref:Lipoprotein n=1 Tax=Paenibacillus sophorae TaxID=1333845 RepID=A0A1H8JRL2_9BACL|nr:hypothetical protein [Paenibacillus sophorae]QWU13460.1 hypothetical protein KP014_15800 [Paenibacillus sophorae]SEN83352.1 hypothetical protein SAMN04487895_103127 [Paenibacillus sophorae]